MDRGYGQVVCGQGCINGGLDMGCTPARPPRCSLKQVVWILLECILIIITFIIMAIFGFSEDEYYLRHGCNI